MEKKMTHAIERKAFEVAIDAAIKHTNKDRSSTPAVSRSYGKDTGRRLESAGI